MALISEFFFTSYGILNESCRVIVSFLMLMYPKQEGFGWSSKSNNNYRQKHYINSNVIKLLIHKPKITVNIEVESTILLAKSSSL